MQALLPIMAGVLSAKQDLHSFTQAMGHAAVERVFEDEVTALVGPKSKHQLGRTRYRWGKSDAQFTLSGRRVTLARPRVRERGSQRVGVGRTEVPSARVEQFQAAFFSATNPMENLIGTLRDVSHNVKRWRKGDMIKRWSGIGLIEASKRFRRIKGHARMSTLIVALRGEECHEQAVVARERRLHRVSAPLPLPARFQQPAGNPPLRRAWTEGEGDCG